MAHKDLYSRAITGYNRPCGRHRRGGESRTYYALGVTRHGRLGRARQARLGLARPGTARRGKAGEVSHCFANGSGIVALCCLEGR